MNNRYMNIAIHIVMFLLAITALYLTGTNPRVLLYAYFFGLFYRLPTIAYIANHQSPLLLRATRLPTRFDKNTTVRNARTNEPAGLATYIGGSITAFGCLLTVMILAQGTHMLRLEVLIPELTLAAVIGLLFWLEDITTKQLILDPNATLPKNLNYNSSIFHFMLGSIFISILVLFVTIPFMMGEAYGESQWMDWVLLITLSLLILYGQIKIDLANKQGFAHLSKFADG